MSTPVPSRRTVLALLATAPAALLVRPISCWAMPTATADALDPQPHMRLALASLRSAKEHLQKASPDKGGHRVKALDLLQGAIRETEAGIKYDNRR